jgi:hypothetical protein
MTESRSRTELFGGLTAFGADFSKWPGDRLSGAREAVLGDLDFRRAWERERDLDRAMTAARGEIDAAIGGAGAVERLREATLARLPRPRIGTAAWRGIAAAMLVAGVLGGALELIATEQAGETADIAVVDPVLYGLEPTETQ